LCFLFLFAVVGMVEVVGRYNNLGWMGLEGEGGGGGGGGGGGSIVYILLSLFLTLFFFLSFPLLLILGF